MRLVGHKIRLRPNARQEEFFRRCVGTARFAYNLALGGWQSQYRSGKKPNECALRREINARKRAEWPWMLEVPKSVVQQAVKNVGEGAIESIILNQKKLEIKLKLWLRETRNILNHGKDKL